jgi:hypothetical protein
MVKYRAGTLERSMSSRSSADDLYRKVARKILVESLSVKKGESVTVETWNNGLPFARQVVLEARKMGAIPLTIFEDEDTYVEGVHKTPKDVLGKMGKQEYKLLSGTDAYVFIPGPGEFLAQARPRRAARFYRLRRIVVQGRVQGEASGSPNGLRLPRRGDTGDPGKVGRSGGHAPAEGRPSGLQEHT